MKEKLNSLVKKILLGATAALTATPVQSLANTSGKINHSTLTTEISVSKFNKFSKTPKLVLNKAINALYAGIGHGSHASHSSHASHYSSSTPTTTTDEKTNSQDNSKTPTSSDPQKISYELGSRILKWGMTGTDVAALQDSLISKGYDIEITGILNIATEEALKEFQKKNNIEPSGILDVKTLYYLKKK
jgi:hypothetical protein